MNDFRDGFNPTMDNARAFRSSINFLMALAATGSIFYLGLNHFRPDLTDKLFVLESSSPTAPAVAASPEVKSIHAPRSQGWNLAAAVEKLLDADREFLHERGLGTPSAPRIQLSNLKVSAADAQTVGANQGGTSVLAGLRRADTPAPLAQTQGRIFIPVNLQMTELAVKPAPKPRRPPSQPAEARAPAQATGRTVSAAQVPGHPRAQPKVPNGFAVVEARTKTVTEPASQPKSSGGFAEIGGQHTPATATSKPLVPAALFLEEDAETIERILQTAAADIRALPQADALLGAFARRYPRDARTAEFTKRLTNLNADRREAKAERARIGELTVLQEVPFGADVRAAMGACLSAVRDLERVAIAVREVKFQPQFPAYMVSLRFRNEGETHSAPPGDPQSGEAEAARQTAEQAQTVRRLDAAAPCLRPLFVRGTVAVFLAGLDRDKLPVARLEVIPAAITFDATSTAAAAFAK